eukprot:CAMPEP_0184370534 /NCGR_PEP_ID=MMETSP1089-20130417/162879_1 /TAXON_ID=38269 ORGANISM="Gloeochaete wittrockiana, Strain SAG46.84" /NCGR_SAMPLE_ID=MMETSP1089 /ASSEMBLY_ACC=CAM_ASM_000445 /LENGTH=697 /DNA_ID=CAMNT_0026713159 /DNA_START=491 /DNA_END=2581 /DNA_ORIENTATION=-
MATTVNGATHINARKDFVTADNQEPRVGTHLEIPPNSSLARTLSEQSTSRPSMNLKDFSTNTQPCNVYFDNVKYWVDVKTSTSPFSLKKAPKDLLKGVSGYCEAGQLLAVMGPSGSGKSTLLDLLAGRKTLGTASGDVFVNSERAFQQKSDGTISTSSKLMRNISGYVVQDDSMFEFLTVSEILQYFADLRMPASGGKERQDKVAGVLAQLGLTRVKDSKIGGAFIRGISGGEKRRVSIACELVTSPPILFLDEPTSGLSSSDAYVVMKILKNLTFHGHTIVTTIHQPSAEIYRMFDRLLLLARGEAVYFGRARDAVPYFEELGFVKDDVTSAAEFVLKVVTPGYDFGGSNKQAANVKGLLSSSKPNTPTAANNKETEFTAIEVADLETIPEQNQVATDDETGVLTEEEIHTLATIYRSKPIGQKAMERVAEAVHPSNGSGANGEGTKKEIDKAVHTASPALQFYYLALRNLTLMSRNPNEVVATVMQGIVMGILLGTLLRSNAEVTNFLQIQGIFILLVAINYSYFQALGHLIFERAIINREVAGNLYSVKWWYLARTLTSIPFYSVALLPFACIMHGFLSFRSDTLGWGYYIFIVLVFSNVTASVTEFVASISPDFASSAIISNFILAISFMFGGFLVPRQSVPSGWVWAYYIDYFTYGFSGMMVNQFSPQSLSDPANPLNVFGLQPEYFLGKQW